MNKTRSFLKKLITVSLLVTVIVSLIFGEGRFSSQRLLINFIYSFVFAAGNMLFFTGMDKLIGWKKSPKKTLIFSLLGTIPLNISLFYFLNFFFSYFVFKQSLHHSLQIESYFTYVFVTIFSLSIALFILMIIFFKMVSEEKIKNEKLKTETAKSRFESLKTQLNPHFLFNNLNVLTALIHENPDKAEQFTIELSDIYRYLLSTEDKALVSLEEELDFSRKYLHLLELRFENKIRFSFPEKIPAEKKVPPLSLQLLMENALKHNVFSEENPLFLQIGINGDYLSVENNLHQRKTKETTQKGLNNLIQRYRLLTGHPVIIQKENGLFTVKIPLL